MNRKKVLEIKNLVKNYGTNGFCATVLKGIDLEIYKNDFIAVMGQIGRASCRERVYVLV